MSMDVLPEEAAERIAWLDADARRQSDAAERAVRVVDQTLEFRGKLLELIEGTDAASPNPGSTRSTGSWTCWRQRRT